MRLRQAIKPAVDLLRQPATYVIPFVLSVLCLVLWYTFDGAVIYDSTLAISLERKLPGDKIEDIFGAPDLPKSAMNPETADRTSATAPPSEMSDSEFDALFSPSNESTASSNPLFAMLTIVACVYAILFLGVFVVRVSASCMKENWPMVLASVPAVVALSYCLASDFTEYVEYVPPNAFNIQTLFFLVAISVLLILTGPVYSPSKK